MILDDESYNCDVLKTMILSMDIDPQRLIVCMSGKEALSKMKEVKNEGGRISLVLTDLSMPMMDGYKFIKKFKRLEGEQKATIAAITGHAESHFFLNAFKKGADHVYSKPVSSIHISLLMLQAGFIIKANQKVMNALNY